MSKPKRRQIILFTPELEAEFERKTRDYLTESNNSTLVSRGRRQNKHLKKRSEEGAAKTATWAKDHPVLNTVSLATASVPFAVASYPGAVVGGELLGTALTNPYVDAGLTSVFGAHGLNHAINEGIADWKDGVMTALEVTPLGRLAKPLYEGVVQPGMKLFNSPLTGNWTKIGNREYRLSPNSFGVNGSPIESRSITPQITAENAASITPEQWTAAQDAAIARGDMAEAQRLSDLHMKTKASNTLLDENGNPLHLYRGDYNGVNPRGGKEVYYRNPNTGYTIYINKSELKPGQHKEGVYLNSDEKYALQYAGLKENPMNRASTAQEGKTFIDFAKKDALGDFYINAESITKEDIPLHYSDIVSKYGNDIQRTKPYDVLEGDVVPHDAPGWYNTTTGKTYVVRDPKNIKLADAVTYDPLTGERIPLGDRHDFSKNDVLWGLAPFLGLGAASALYSKKQGGKMNTLLFLKNGSGIHIKKKNRGKFTEYCGGKVTDACIKRAKASGNPTLVKRATFAANARKWKHKNGGILFAQEGATFGLKVNNFLNSDTGKFAINLGSTLANSVLKTINDSKLKLKLLDWKNAYVNAVTPEDFSNLIEAEESQKQLSNPDYNSSPIEMRHRAYELEQQALAKAKQLRALEADLYIALILLNNQSSNEGGFGSLLSQGLGLVGLYLSNKTPNTSTTSTKTDISFTPTKDYIFNKDLRDKVNNKFASNFYNWTYTEKGDS